MRRVTLPRNSARARGRIFERFFAKHNGVWGECWCMFYHSKRAFPNKGRATENKRAKKALIEKRRSHGIIVYSEGTPVGWCQYGPTAELPRLDQQNIPELRTGHSRAEALANNMLLHRQKQPA